ncbi:hypothetical protein EV368DRAFT_67012 [Lentinula lateritia]|nr:hypothetical protein EV368DRAFT_67012 [Lentinula lateritia]
MNSDILNGPGSWGHRGRGNEKNTAADESILELRTRGALPSLVAVESGARKNIEYNVRENVDIARKGNVAVQHILILNVCAMSERLQTTGKCKHTKFLPLNEPPLRRGVVDRTCFHVTPVYYLGWYIPRDEIFDYYPEAGGKMPTFWTKEVMIPWVRDYDAKYKSNERHCYFRPELAYVTGTKQPHLLVFIFSNRTQEFIDMSRNEQFIKDAARIAHVKDFFGEVRWIRR